MDLSIKIRLFWHAGGDLLKAIFIIFVLSLIGYVFPTDSPFPVVFLIVMKLSPIAFVTAVLVIWLKVRRGVMAVTDGRRLEATVLGTRVNSYNDGEPINYVLTWKDTDGFTGASLPGSEKSFEGLKSGDRIIVYKNNQHDSWWDRDAYGTLIKSSS